MLLSVIVIIVTVLTYVITIEFLGHGLIPALISPLGLFALIPIWKKHTNVENADVINNMIRNVSTSEKFAFVLLLLFVSSILRATGMRMSFTVTLVLIGVIFFIYKMITMKTTSDENQPMSIKKSEMKTIKFISNARKNLIFIILAILLSIIVLFYWFEIRPSKIRQECSFVTKHVEAISARPVKTESELLSEGVIKPCSIYEQIFYGQFSNDLEDKQFCENRNKVIIESYSKPIPAEEAKNILEPVSKEKYDFCVRSRGLKN